MTVQHPTWGGYFHETEPIELNPGTHVLNVTIQGEELRTAFFIYDTLTRRGGEGLQRQVGWSPTRRLTVYGPSACRPSSGTCVAGSNRGVQTSSLSPATSSIWCFSERGTDRIRASSSTSAGTWSRIISLAATSLA